ncbi:MAG TPA: CRISPR-associated helicase Cas3' [Rubrivivax sp.]|nr:CRISPR-associated helicase Cas3' [Rubrivivax sp.]
MWQPWGKLCRRSVGDPRTLSLVDHMTDVALLMRSVLGVHGIRRAAETSADRPLLASDLARLAALAFLHDIGKANVGFQGRYWEKPTSRPKGWPAVECGHGPQGWALFDGSLHGASRLLAGLPLDEMGGWGDAVAPLLHASISHHGRPVAADSAAAIWEPVLRGDQLFYDPADAIAAMGRKVQELFPDAFVTDAPELPDSPAFAHLFAGLVQLADWMGSDTRVGFFPYSEPGERRADTAPARARHALRTVGLDVGDAATRRAVARCDFARAFGVPAPRPMQAAMADDALGPVVVLEAETGSGKTEAALWRFLHLWRHGQVDALYLALPTRVAATQLYERVLAFVHRVWPADPPVAVRALPGYASADGQTAKALPEFQVLWSDNPADADAERRWAAESPKRYLAAMIAVGTVDQALLGALQVKHAHLRQAMLARSLLVVDEVHASDAYMTRLLEHLLRAHVACGGQALLLSATLGAAARTRYLSIGSRSKKALSALAAAEAMPYPTIGHLSADGPALRPVEGNPRDKTVHWEARDIIDQPQQIAALAVDAAVAGARVLVVRNTVPAAVATLKSVEALAAARGLDCLFRVAGVSTLHHSRFSRQDRPLLDAEVQAKIGKQRSARPGLVVIGTQTLEQSLDIDADLLITDLCPMDVLLQRLGRLHRHARPSAQAPDDLRPPGFEAARAWVLTPPGHDLAPLLQRQSHGLGPIRMRNEPMAGVYVDLRVLEATRRLVMAQPMRQLPADNRVLVEQATHPEALDAIARELGDAWQRFGMEYEGALAANQAVANLHALPFDRPYGEQFPDDEGRIGSRLGAADRIVGFDPPVAGPFGQTVTQLALRHHQLPRGLPLDAQASTPVPLPDGTGFTFELGATLFRYSRWGVERIDTKGRHDDDAA